MKPNSKSEIRNPKQIQNSKHPTLAPRRNPFGILDFGHSCLFRISNFESRISILGALTLGILLVGGCATQPPTPPLEICPGQPTVEAALQTLTARARNAVPVWANGRAVLTYHAPDQKKPERHSLDIVFRLDPPARLYLQGGPTGAPKAVILGSNEEEFWLALKPKDISSFYLGRWQEVRDFEGLVMSPRIVLEAIGIVNVPGSVLNPALWKLENKGPYDILTQRDQSGRPARRLHVYACDYSVRQIEYFDPRGKVVAVAQLDGYQPVVEGFQVPTQINVVSTRPEGRKDSVVMELSSVRTKAFNERQRQGLFNPPETDRFEHIYHYIDGQWVEE